MDTQKIDSERINALEGQMKGLKRQTKLGFFGGAIAGGCLVIALAMNTADTTSRAPQSPDNQAHIVALGDKIGGLTEAIGNLAERIKPNEQESVQTLVAQAPPQPEVDTTSPWLKDLEENVSNEPGANTRDVLLDRFPGLREADDMWRNPGERTTW